MSETVYGDDFNVCCPFLIIAGCADTEEHKHISCEIWVSENQGVIIDNKWVIDYCLCSYSRCKLYSKKG